MNDSMKIDLILASGIKTNRELHEKTVVVIDVLRASSTIITALANGCVDLLPVAEPGDAAFINRQIGACCLTGGERNGLKIPGFDLGNSPLEYTAEAVGGRQIILTTSNGTQALLEAHNADEILIGSFLNAERTSSYLATNSEVVFFCAGSNGEPGLEDLLCAGLMTEQLLAGGVEAELTDGAKLGLITYRYLLSGPKAKLADVLRQSLHAKRLIDIGFSADLDYCAQSETRPCLVRYQDGRITLDHR